MIIRLLTASPILSVIPKLHLAFDLALPKYHYVSQFYIYFNTFSFPYYFVPVCP